MEVTENNHMFQEMETLFPGQVVAVVTRGRNIDLQLGEQPFPRPADQRVAVTLSVQNEAIEILTYSGSPVCVEAAGTSICLTPLITGSGEVVLVGESGLLDHQSGIRAAARTIHGT